MKMKMESRRGKSGNSGKEREKTFATKSSPENLSFGVLTELRDDLKCLGLLES